MFKIVSESGIAAGMRRIEAVTGEGALNYAQEVDSLLSEIQAVLNSPRKEIVQHLEKLRLQLEEAEKENRAARRSLARLKTGPEESQARKIKDISVLAQRVEGLTMEELRDLADSFKQRIGTGVIVLGTAAEGKAFLVVSVSKDLVQRISAEAVVREIAPLIGGGGGGRPDFAQAGGKKPDSLQAALEKSYAVIERMA
jgi:alanyl-tRNA synthetase